jgi:hypothetical protein
MLVFHSCSHLACWLKPLEPRFGPRAALEVQRFLDIRNFVLVVEMYKGQGREAFKL